MKEGMKEEMNECFEGGWDGWKKEASWEMMGRQGLDTEPGPQKSSSTHLWELNDI